jgi:hypothetical protein
MVSQLYFAVSLSYFRILDSFVYFIHRYRVNDN